MFRSVLIANRGEIAVRVQRTLRALGIRAIAVYSDADRDARHVREADEAVRLGPASPRESYLDIDRVLAAARRTGAEALHPGYGFLAESAALAQACADAGITFIGPPAAAIAAMGDKIRAREMVAAAGVPVVPGGGAPGMSDSELVDLAHEIGFPVLLKPSAGGGGKGMRVVTDTEQLAAAIAAARREARAAFGDDTLLVERFVTRPHHIEIQVAADTHGNVVHLGERECSLQRRHQKIVEEAPSPYVSDAMRAQMGAQAIAVARACGYTNVGTVEFIVSGERADEFFFMEMNTRLQVEHAVTEEIYGVDLVELQLHIAAGEPLPWQQRELVPRGHAIEARVYAEDPAAGFLPTGGTVVRLREPDGVRVDSALREGLVVGSDYDPMLAKITAWGSNRVEALDRLSAALAHTTVLGVTTNLAHLRALLDIPEVRAGDIDTGLVERTDFARAEVPPVVRAAALVLQLHRAASDGLWGSTTGWRLGGHAWIAGDGVRVQWNGDGWLAAVDDGEPFPLRVDIDGAQLVVAADDHTKVFDWAVTDDELWVAGGGQTWTLPIGSRTRTRARRALAGDGEVTSPMPGTVVAVNVAVGDVVREGQPLAVVEAMKMEHTLTAPFDGVVEQVHVKAGEQVALRQPVVTVAAAQEHEG